MQPIQILLDQLKDIARNLLEMLPQLLIAIIVLSLTYLVALGARSLAKRLLRRTRLRKACKICLSYCFLSLSGWPGL